MAAGADDGLDHLVQRLLVAAGGDHGGAGPRQTLSQHPADPAARAGHDGELAVQGEIRLFHMSELAAIR